MDCPSAEMGSTFPKQGPTTVLLFGPQCVSSNVQSLLYKLRAKLHDEHGDKNRSRHWIFAILAELPSFLDGCATKIPKLRRTRDKNRKHLTDLHRWLNDSSLPQGELHTSDLPNVILTPLVVLAQLLEYWQYLELNQDVSGRLELPSQNHQTLGLCIGILSAFAIAASKTREDLKLHGAVAVRLAVMVGAAVDILDMERGRATSLAAAWNTSQQDTELQRILDKFPDDAYKSVMYDNRRATLTVSANAAPDLLRHLGAAGIVAAEVGLHGRFHTAANQDMMEALLTICDGSHTQFPDAAQLLMCSYNNTSDEPLSRGPLHKHALQAILVQRADWHNTLDAVYGKAGSNTRILGFGPEQCVPPSMMRNMGVQLVELGFNGPKAKPQPTARLGRDEELSDIRDDDIAIIGLSIKVAGADDVPEFSDLLHSGKSQHVLVPASRVHFGTASTPWRPEAGGCERYGNFIRDIDAFDHRFFRRSPRESAAMDPQQRLLLQAAYQAVEMAGWFATAEEKRDSQVGVYVGTCATDYEHQAACHPAGAFSATGLLRSFIPGKVAQFFGWTGPAMTLDTACSGSAVAIHTACRAMLNGECSFALCGGVNTIGSPLWFQNLEGASFLSPSGQCKPFDELADGYCRGEGIACVFLRPMKAALANGNRILGCIKSTAVYQNDNSTPLFVPNVPSLSRLFRDVVHRAGLSPEDLSLVEAHGTGTPAGDPAEYQSIRQALAGPLRSKPLPIGSAKGLVGHTESASGVVSLIKVITMMHEAFIPPQASYTKLSHNIDASATDMIGVPTRLRTWNETRKVALINNYGASGSNASMVVRQAPHNGHPRSPIHSCVRHPFRIKGLDEASIQRYRAKFESFVRSKEGHASLADFAFNVAYQSSHSLMTGLFFTASSVPELLETLSSSTIMPRDVKPPRPVILCFGGQVSSFVGLDRRVYDSVRILRRYIHECDTIVRSLGLSDGMFPDIFIRSPIKDNVKLQTMLFALQYASAMSWIDNGLRVQAIVGHSFGEITALCVSGVLSLVDAIKLVAGRARVVRDTWGTDPGAMIAVEADLAVVERLLGEANSRYNGMYPAGIACHNGPRSFTLAGAADAIEALLKTVYTQSDFASVKCKVLNVTNAFHSTLVEPLRSALDQVSQALTFNEPIIRLERSLETKPATSKPTSSFVFEHMRSPVFFNHAVQRLAKDYPSSVWLEAGSASTVTVLANRALGSRPEMHFQALKLTNDKAFEHLSDTTVALWNEGVQVAFWAHHGIQTTEYKPLIMPPYQFEKTRHWLEFKPVAKAFGMTESPPVGEGVKLGLWTFISYQDSNHRRARFRINTGTEEYKVFISGHIAAQMVPICPATLEIAIAIEALYSLQKGGQETRQPVVLEVQNSVALCDDPARTVWLDLETSDSTWSDCMWKIITTLGNRAEEVEEILCVKGRIELRSVGDESYRTEFARYERLVGYQGCIELLGGAQDEADQILQDQDVYVAFNDIVQYGEYYQNVKRVVGRANECAGLVKASHSSGTWLNVPVSDACSQVAGLWVNCMTDCPAGDMFLATGVEMMMRSPNAQRAKAYHVFGRHYRASDKEYLSDVFVFDASNGRLFEVILGIQYSRVAKTTLRRVLTRLAGDLSGPNKGSNTAVETIPVRPVAFGENSEQSSLRDVSQSLRTVIANVCGVEADDIQEDSEMAQLGVDSLMSMELAREVANVLKCKLDPLDLLEATRFRDLIICTSKALYGEGYHIDEDRTSFDKEDGVSSDSESAASTALTLASLDTREKDQLPDVQEPATRASLNTSILHHDLEIPPLDILAAFGQVKWSTDQRLRDAKLEDIDSVIVARSNRLCVALIVEAWEQLDCPIRTALAGQILPRIQYQARHARLVEWLYDFMSKDARLIQIDHAGQVFRTGISTPRKSGKDLYHELLQSPDTWIVAHKLLYHAGSNLADVLRGAKDGVGVLFGSADGRDLIQGLYCDLPYNRIAYQQMRDFIGQLVDRLNLSQSPLKILELGAGTGGTTRILLPFLAELGVPLEYTFTDLSPSMVSQARNRFKTYPFMRFAVHDMENLPAPELRGQHVVLASNAVHATHNLRVSLGNIREALRDDGLLALAEMTEGLPFVDLVFGLLEGWWLFNDGRRHALVSETKWETELQAAGFGHVDWTDGKLAENKIQRVIIALASGPAREKCMRTEAPVLDGLTVAQNGAAREAEAEAYVAQYSAGFNADVPYLSNMPHIDASSEESGSCVVLTGGTGSLGSYLAASFASRSEISTVVCLNRRRGSSTPVTRQQEAFTLRGISLPLSAQEKLRVMETDIDKPGLGLPDEDYLFLASHTSHIVHNAWPMSGTRRLRAFEPQFVALKNLLDLAAAAWHLHGGRQITFQLISSIGVVGHYPVTAGDPAVPEDRVAIAAVLPGGYCEAKWTCERLLDETLHRYPERFRAMVVRPGQIAGSRKSGYWNPVEHFPFMVKSAQELQVFPVLQGRLQWVPVDDVAATVVDLALRAGAVYPVYHIDNPAGQPWGMLVQTLAWELGISELIPFRDWLRRVRRSPLSMEIDNPALRVVDFLDKHFEHMSCGGMVLDTARTIEHSATMSTLGPVSSELAKSYIRAWKSTGFLRDS